MVHDELDIPPGQMKLKKGGGNGGHNGLKDIQAQLGTGDFWRLRLGIGHPGDRNEVAAYVLRKPPAAERELIEKNVDDSLKALELLLAGEMDKATIKIHAKPPRPKPPRPPQLNPLLSSLMNKVPAATPSPSKSPASPAGPASAGTQEPAE